MEIEVLNQLNKIRLKASNGDEGKLAKFNLKKHKLTCGPMHGVPFIKTDNCSAINPKSDVKSVLNGVNPMYLKIKPHDGNHE